MAAVTTFFSRQGELAAKRTGAEESGGFGVRGSAPLHHRFAAVPLPR